MLINFNHLKTFYNALVQKMKDFRGNWNQNDASADDYIKNRPFYSEAEKVTILKESSHISSSGSFFIVEAPIALKDGTVYQVVYNGIEYKCRAEKFIGPNNLAMLNVSTYEEAADSIVLGNVAILTGTGNTGEPFIIMNYPGYAIEWVDLSEAAACTIGIYENGEIIHKIDPKYLPDDIGVPENVITEDNIYNALENRLAPVAFTNNYNSLSGKPTIYTNVIRYDTEQNLISNHQAVARSNIGAASQEQMDDVSNQLTKVITYDKQNLTAGQQSQARNNINVYSKEETYDKTEETSCTITWDGDFTNKDHFRFSFGAIENFYKVADITTFNADDVVSISSIYTDNNSHTNDFFGDGVRKLGKVIVANKAGYCRLYNSKDDGVWADVSIPSAGIYFERFYSNSSLIYYVESATITYKARTIPKDVIGIVRTVNGIEPDLNGNINIITDWNQNDQNALGYIKNRTHYEYLEEIIAQTETLPVSTEEKIITFTNVPFKFRGNEERIRYSITIPNNNPELGEVLLNKNYLGQKMLFVSNYTYGFSIYYKIDESSNGLYDVTLYVINSKTEKEYTFTCKYLETVKLDPKYLPIEELGTALNIASKQDVITGTSGQFVVIGEDGNVTTKTIPYAEEVEF